MEKKSLYLIITSSVLLLLLSCINEPPGTTSSSPAVSPDGKFIAYFCTPFNGDKATRGVYIIRIDGKDKKLIYPQDYGAVQGAISWSPSGRQLLIQEGIITLSDNYSFKEIRKNELLSAIDEIWKHDVSFSWAPDGKSILYNIDDSIYVADTLFQNSRKLPLSGKKASWTPDGESLIYLKNDEIYIADTISYGEKRITNDGRPKNILIPSPDGTTLSYTLFDEDIYLVNIDGTSPRFLTKTHRNSFSWMPDSKSVIYSKMTDGWSTFLWKIDIDGKNDMQIFK